MIVGKGGQGLIFKYFNKSQHKYEIIKFIKNHNLVDKLKYKS